MTCISTVCKGFLAWQDKGKRNESQPRRLSRHEARRHQTSPPLCPASTCKSCSTLVGEDPEIIHVPVTREEEGVGICAGAWMGGRRPALLMQNSGLGNSINALASLDMLYGIPLLMIISHRGGVGEPIIGQVPMGRLTVPLLDAMQIPHFSPSLAEAEETVAEAWNRGCSEPQARGRAPGPGVLEGKMKRIEAIALAAEAAQAQDALLISNIGFPSRELFSVKDRPENFYMLGSMGLASSIGLGLALARPERKVMVLDGDGSVLMNLGTLATIAHYAPENYLLVILDNCCYGSTGSQPTCTHLGTDLFALAQGGWRQGCQEGRQGRRICPRPSWARSSNRKS